MTFWRLAPSLQRLFGERNRRFPKHDEWSDGSLGDTSHATRFSDHNPDGAGWVHAIDIDATVQHEMGTGPIGDYICRVLLRQARSGRLRNVLHYIIYRGLIWSKSTGWRPHTYTGSNSHHSHVHVSIDRTAGARGWSKGWGVLVPQVSMDRIHRAWNRKRVKVSPVHVARLQRRYKAKGYLKRPFVWGMFGRKTEDAAKRYAKRHGFDSPVGRRCITKLCGDFYWVVDD